MDTQSVIICDNSQSEEPARKRFRPTYLSTEYFICASTSSTNTEVNDDVDHDDEESVHSWQSYETAWVADSGDDWSFTDDDSEESSSVTEYEVIEDDTIEESQDSDSSTSVEIYDVHFPEGLLPTQVSESSSSLTDESSSADCNGETIGFFGSGTSKSRTSWQCFQCRAPTIAPRNFCFTCYQRRKSSRPPRPRKLKKLEKTATIPSCPDDDNDRAVMLISAPAASNENLCAVCHIGFRDGAFVHRKTAHVACCFSCTEKIFKNRKAKCPICRQSIQNIVKIFF